MNDDSFFSMDKLVEFGLGMAVAQQMTQTMNSTLNNMQMPGVGNQMQNTLTQSGTFYVMIEGKQVGPLSEAELSQLIQQKKVTKETYVWKIGMKDWTTAENVPEVLKLVCLMPPVFNPNN